jgi:hypothetical protein
MTKSLFAKELQGAVIVLLGIDHEDAALLQQKQFQHGIVELRGQSKALKFGLTSQPHQVSIFPATPGFVNGRSETKANDNFFLIVFLSDRGDDAILGITQVRVQDQMFVPKIVQIGGLFGKYLFSNQINGMQVMNFHVANSNALFLDSVHEIEGTILVDIFQFGALWHLTRQVDMIGLATETGLFKHSHSWDVVSGGVGE